MQIFFLRMKPASPGLQICSSQLRILIAGLLFQTKVTIQCSIKCPTFLSYHAAVLLLHAAIFVEKSIWTKSAQVHSERFSFYVRQQYKVLNVEPSSQLRQWSRLFLWKEQSPRFRPYNEDLFLKRILHCHKCFSFVFGKKSLFMASSLNKHSNMKRNH